MSNVLPKAFKFMKQHINLANSGIAEATNYFIFVFFKNS